ncbi:MAG: metal ABC transporter solute-binding protein, Zn/Mn family, partial [Mycobacteriales bacterium]
MRRGIWGGAILLTALLTACTAAPSPVSAAGKVTAIGAESQYANVIAQVGGQYVLVHAILTNPNLDPHSFEAGASLAKLVSEAGLVVQNGLGYDTFMNHVEAATPGGGRHVIEVQRLLRLPDSTPNPHLWYDPTVMPRVARAIAAALTSLQPAHASYFQERLARFDESLRPWQREIAFVKAHFGKVKVATTEPVADYLISAVGAINATPW